MAELKGKESSKEASVDLVKHTSDGFSSSLKMQRIKEKENNNTSPEELALLSNFKHDGRPALFLGKITLAKNLRSNW